MKIMKPTHVAPASLLLARKTNPGTMWVSGFLPDQHTTKAFSSDREGGDDGLVVNGLVLLEKKHMCIYIYIYITLCIYT
jgi:hypothetical protein